MADDRQPKPFDRETLQLAFARLGEMALAQGKIVEISVYGGSALILTLPSRPATQDVDAVFETDRAFVRQATREIAEDFGWDRNWLNDGVKGFLSGSDAAPEAKSVFATYPSEDEPGLRVFVASPPYLFAMKCMAMRMGGEGQRRDVDDIRGLGQLLQVANAQQALEIVMRYYPAGKIPVKTQYGLEDIFSSEA